MDYPAPDDLEHLAGWQYACACGRTHAIRTRKVLIDPGAIQSIPHVIDELHLPRTAWMLADDNTFAAAGRTVLRTLRHAGIAVEYTILKPHAGYIGADETYLAQARHGVWDRAELVIGVGSGTINDLARMLAQERNTQYIVVATAPSMNGYGSPISAFLEKGIKLTIPSAPTDAIIADLDVLTAAPLEMAQAGFGDLLAKNTSNTDWFLAGLIRNDPYCTVPVDIVRRASARTAQVAGDIRTRAPHAIKVLTEGLIAGAFAMDAAGVTSPASGGEHLISHYMEMVAHVRNVQPPMHGQQVALGTIIASTLYELLAEIDIDAIDIDTLVAAHPDWPTREAHVRREHGELADIIMPEVRKQHLTPTQYRDRLLADAAADSLLKPLRQPDQAATRVEAHTAVGGRQTPLEQVHRRHAHERGDKAVRGVVVHLLRRGTLVEHAVTHHRDPVPQGHGLFLVVGDVDHRTPQPAVELL